MFPCSWLWSCDQVLANGRYTEVILAHKTFPRVLYSVCSPVSSVTVDTQVALEVMEFPSLCYSGSLSSTYSLNFHYVSEKQSSNVLSGRDSLIHLF